MMIATWKSKVYNNIIESQRKSKSNKSVKCVNGDMSMGTCFFNNSLPKVTCLFGNLMNRLNLLPKKPVSFDKHPKYQKEISC